MRQASVGKETTIVYDERQAQYQIELRERGLYVQYSANGELIVPSQITKDECDHVFERVLDAFAEIEHAERLNGRVGSKSLFK